MSHWRAMDRWDDAYLRATIGDAPVHVARTPNGMADAMATLPSGERVFAKPEEVLMPFASFFSEMQSALYSPEGRQLRPVLYASHQNSSLTGEYPPLLWADVDLSLGWADDAFGSPPAATNFWLGEDAARTTVHADLFDNVYVVVRGEKHFWLLPPQDGHLLRRRRVRTATYTTVGNSGEAAVGAAGNSMDGRAALRGTASGANQLELQLDSPPATCYWSEVDLENENGASLTPQHVVIRAGEVLMLPALWWHHVAQRAQPADGHGCSATVAVNYWYDVDSARQSL